MKRQNSMQKTLFHIVRPSALFQKLHVLSYGRKNDTAGSRTQGLLLTENYNDTTIVNFSIHG